MCYLLANMQGRGIRPLQAVIGCMNRAEHWRSEVYRLKSACIDWAAMNRDSASPFQNSSNPGEPTPRLSTTHASPRRIIRPFLHRLLSSALYIGCCHFIWLLRTASTRYMRNSSAIFLSEEFTRKYMNI